MAKRDLTVNRIRELLSYDQSSGVFTWNPVAAGHKHVKSGYIGITIDGVEFKAHRLAWLLAFGEWPKGVIDHINGNRSDNRISNLRDATFKTNAENRRRARAGSASKLMGAQWHEQRGKWQASITSNGKRFHLGLFETQEEAHEAYISAKRKKHVGCTV